MLQGIDTVEISRIDKLCRDLDTEGLLRFFSQEELNDAGGGEGRLQKLAARFAAKEACCKLFPKEICLGVIEPYDFSVSKDGYGKPMILATERARAVMNRYRVASISISMTHTMVNATAVASPEPMTMAVPWYGRLIYHLLPLRRKIVLENLHRVFGDTLSEDHIILIAQAYYGHFVKFLLEFVRMAFMSRARRTQMVRIEGVEHLAAARDQGRGVLLLTGHFGNWEVSTVAGMAQFPQYQGLLHFIRRPLKPGWLNRMVMRRFQNAGFGTLEKSGSLDEILDLLEDNRIVVCIFDQFTIKKYGIPSEFFGHPAHTFKSLAVLAQFTGAPVIPSSSWREPDGTHVLCFEAPVEVEVKGRTRDILSKNTKRFNEIIERIILRHPEQWIWMHKRWKAISRDAER